MPENSEQQEFVFPNACPDPRKSGWRSEWGNGVIFVLIFMLGIGLIVVSLDALIGKPYAAILSIAISGVFLGAVWYSVFRNLKTVVVRDGRVSVYDGESTTVTPIFEAPYESFSELSVDFFSAAEGVGPEYSVHLHHKSNDGQSAKSRPMIRLMWLESGRRLSDADRETVYALAKEMQIPVLENHTWW